MITLNFIQQSPKRRLINYSKHAIFILDINKGGEIVNAIERAMLP